MINRQSRHGIYEYSYYRQSGSIRAHKAVEFGITLGVGCPLRFPVHAAEHLTTIIDSYDARVEHTGFLEV